MKRISVVIPTLYRPTLSRAVESVRTQTVPPEEIEILVRSDPKVNEYVSRDLAIKDATTEYIALLDDDAYYNPDCIEKALKYLDDGYGIVQGIMHTIWGGKLDYVKIPFTGQGTTLFFRKDAYEGVGGFKLEWGTEPQPGGWRYDTIFLYDMIRAYSEKAYYFAHDIVIEHPGMMHGTLNPDIEVRFFLEYRAEVEKWILPIDERMKFLLKEKGLL